MEPEPRLVEQLLWPPALKTAAASSSRRVVCLISGLAGIGLNGLVSTGYLTRRRYDARDLAAGESMMAADGLRSFAALSCALLYHAARR